MSDRDELDARFASFASAPTAPLPGAAAAQERGAQRTRRTRAALSGAGALVVVLVVTAGAALGGGGGSALREDRIGPAATPTPTPTVLETGLSAALLDPEDVAAVRGGTWSLRPDDPTHNPLPSGCHGEPRVFQQGTGAASRFFDGPDDTVGQVLRAYAEPAEVAAVFGRLIDSIEACEGTPETLVGGLPGSGPSRIYGSYVDREFLVAFSVERIGSVLSGVGLRTERSRRGSEDAVYEQLPALADAAAAEVRALLATKNPVVEDPIRPVGLLTAEDAATVEAGDWMSARAPGDADLLAPCASSGRQEWQGVAFTGWQVQREAGGTVLAQQVFDYDSTEAAEQALVERREAVEECAQEPIAAEIGTISYDVIETGQIPLIVRVSTQCESCSPGYSYVAVVQVGARLSVLEVEVAEDGDPGAGLTIEYARVAAERLRAAG